jgi:hypothetical protein
MVKLLLSDYQQGITDVRGACCAPFIGYFNVRLITSRKTDAIEVEVVDDLDADNAAGAAAPVSVQLKLRHSDLYLLAFKPAAGREVDLDQIGHTNYNNMTKPTSISLKSVRTAIRTLRTWRNTKEVGATIADASFNDPDTRMHGSASLFTICSLVSEASRFSSVRHAMTVVVENPGHEVAVTGTYLEKIQCWSGASDAYLQHVMVQEGWKTVTNAATAPPLPAPPQNPPPKAALAPMTPPPPEPPSLGEQLMKDIVIVKLPSASKATPPDWQVWAAKRFAAHWT